jgi:hypothetical protein
MIWSLSSNVPCPLSFVFHCLEVIAFILFIYLTPIRFIKFLKPVVWNRVRSLRRFYKIYLSLVFLFSLTIALLQLLFLILCSVFSLFLNLKGFLYAVFLFSVTSFNSWFQECSQRFILPFFVPRLSEAASSTDSLCYPILFLYQFYLHRAVTNLISQFSLQRRAVGWVWVLDCKWPIVPLPSERNWSICWNENWQRKPKYSERTCFNPSLSTNITWTDLSLNPDRHTTDAYCNMMYYFSVNSERKFSWYLTSRIWGFHNGDYKECCLLGCGTV